MRLLRSGALVDLRWIREAHPAPFLDAAGAALVADALRVNSILIELHFDSASLCHDMGAARILLGALAGHPHLRALTVIGERCTDPAALGALLAAILAHDAAALQRLFIYDNGLGDAGLAPLVDALPTNRHLSELYMSNNGMSERFVRERLLPAVRANTRLRLLRCRSSCFRSAAEKVEELVSRR